MSRDLGVVDAIHTLLPEEAALLLGLLTQLGDVWFLFGLTMLAYWLRPSDRERVAVVLGLAFVTAATVEALKPLFGLPRPATPLATAEIYPAALRGLYEATATAGGEGLPSGHATLSTAVWLGLAGAVRIGDARRRLLFAIGILGVISFTRLALGVHFFVDVVLGTLVGLAVLAGVAWATTASPVDRPTTALGLAVVVAATGVSLTATIGSGGAVPHDPLLALTASVGALAGWQTLLVRAKPTDPTASPSSRLLVRRPGRRSRGAVASAAGLGLAALGTTGVALADWSLAIAGGVGLAVGVAVALPVIVPAFDATVATYAPAWVRVGSSGGRDG